MGTDRGLREEEISILGHRGVHSRFSLDLPRMVLNAAPPSTRHFGQRDGPIPILGPGQVPAPHRTASTINPTGSQSVLQRNLPSLSRTNDLPLPFAVDIIGSQINHSTYQPIRMAKYRPRWALLPGRKGIM
jgi:hypothetical protein